MTESQREAMRNHIKALVACTVMMVLVVLYHFGYLPTQQNVQGNNYVRKFMSYDNRGIHSPLDSWRKNAVYQNLAKYDLDSMTTDQVFLTLHSYLDNIDTICQSKLRMGNLGIGGWEVCDDPDVRPVPPCIVYSYGLTNEWGFESDISRLYGCQVFSFNPNIISQGKNQSSLVKFYKMKIGEKKSANSPGGLLHTHQNLRKMLGHDKTTIDVIRMDVETSEWSALADMIANDQLKDVKQLYVEFHIPEKEPSLLLRLKVIQSLEMLGFKRFYVHKNRFCKYRDQRFPVRRTLCYEVHYIKR